MLHQASPLLQSFLCLRGLLDQVQQLTQQHTHADRRTSNLLLDRLQRLLWVNNNWLDQQKYHVVLPIQAQAPEAAKELLASIAAYRIVILQSENAFEGLKYKNTEQMQHPFQITQLFDNFHTGCTLYMNQVEKVLNGLSPQLQVELLEDIPFTSRQELNRKWQQLGADFEAMMEADKPKIVKGAGSSLPITMAKQPKYGFTHYVAT